MPTSAVYTDADGEGVVSELTIHKDDWLTPEMSIKELMGVFDRTGADELAVLDEQREVLGMLSEALRHAPLCRGAGKEPSRPDRGGLSSWRRTGHA